jgi:hypothetical protein
VEDVEAVERKLLVALEKALTTYEMAAPGEKHIAIEQYLKALKGFIHFCASNQFSF